MGRYRWVGYFFLMLLLFSCNQEPDGLEQALRFAGENRPELEKVLAHYASDPNDSLKYKSAVFLIENMPGHYSLKARELDSFRVSIREFGLRHEYPVTDEHLRIVPTKTFEDKYTIPHLPRSQKMYDAHIITASYLIENIELLIRCHFSLVKFQSTTLFLNKRLLQFTRAVSMPTR